MKYLVYNKVYSASASGSYEDGELLVELGTFDPGASTLTYAPGRTATNKDGNRVNKIKIVPVTD